MIESGFSDLFWLVVYQWQDSFIRGSNYTASLAWWWWYRLLISGWICILIVKLFLAVMANLHFAFRTMTLLLGLAARWTLGGVNPNSFPLAIFWSAVNWDLAHQNGATSGWNRQLGNGTPLLLLSVEDRCFCI